MALFFPSTSPTRRKRQQLPWAAMAGLLSAFLSVWMITQVYLLHKQRYEKKLEEMLAPTREARPPGRAIKAEPPRLTLTTPGKKPVDAAMHDSSQ
ncbi:MAG: hypothetical protein RIS79_3549 [Verrucomicrobiota bacterium]|jgi:hypothetical protein